MLLTSRSRYRNSPPSPYKNTLLPAVRFSRVCFYMVGENKMPMYETTVRTPSGDQKDRVYAKDLQEARMLFEQRHGPRNVPYIPKVIPS